MPLFISSHKLSKIYQHTHFIITHILVISHPLHASTTHQSTAVQGRLAYRRAIVQRLIPALRAFSPGLILISAGFDGAQGKTLPCSLFLFTYFFISVLFVSLFLPSYILFLLSTLLAYFLSDVLTFLFLSPLSHSFFSLIHIL